MELSHRRYVAGTILGRGAEGVVVRVHDRETPERPLVAKLLREGVSEERLAGEFALLARLRVPGLVRAHDLARDERTGRPFLIEDFVDGPDAVEWIAADAHARVERLVTMMFSVARTLDGLHDAGFVHGDLKPAHVRVAGQPWVLDLGAAIAGGVTRAFAAPELLAGERATLASDLYALGAVAFACASGAPPERDVSLRTRAPWVPPSVGDVIDRLLAQHPRDRFGGAREVIAALAVEHEHADPRTLGTTLIGREGEVAAILERLRKPASVVYLGGPSGSGKSHVAREIALRAMLAGRAVRTLVASELAPSRLAAIVAHLRGDGGGFVGEVDLLVLDDVDRAPPEVAAAVESYRCRASRKGPSVVVVATRAPEGAECVALGPLADREFASLCAALDIPASAVAEHAGTTSRVPGWLVASRTRAPLSKEAVLARLGEIDEDAKTLLATVALLGGRMRATEANPHRLFVLGLLERGSDGSVRLTVPTVARDIAAALATQQVVARASDLAVADPAVPASVLIDLAERGSRPTLLEEAADRARVSLAHRDELRALTALAEAGHANSARLQRLERLARDTAQTELHARVLGWMDGASDPALASLSCARNAERLARSGDLGGAERLVEQVTDATTREATRGTIALYRADWAEASRALTTAREGLAARGEREELARVDHNLGVVALYRGEVQLAADAFGRALETKRALGDLPGVRAASLNLGLACTRLEDFTRAEAVLMEALAIARSLGEQTGRAWTLAAIAELHVRRGAPREAERFVAEAEAFGDAVPQAIRADLALLRADIALDGGDARTASRAISEVDPELRRDDALLDGRALVLRARATLVSLPSDRRSAARDAIAAIRRARGAGIPEIESKARSVLNTARTIHTHAVRPSPAEVDEHLWRCVATLADAKDAETAAAALGRCMIATAHAERAFVVRMERDRIAAAWGIDADGFPVVSAAERVPREALDAACRTDGPVVLRTKGATVAIAGPHGNASRMIVIAEHRYVPNAFDALAESTARRWATLASLVRVEQVGAPAPVKVIEHIEPSHETTILPTLDTQREFPGILGQSPSLRRALAKLEAALPSGLPVLVVGETGVGKELFARALHEQGPRAKAPFVAVNCAAIPESLFEAELFGHVRGSFTGADRGRGGLASRAKDGTLFLDEIGELPLGRQATLLRVLETRKFRPVGSDEELPLDARIVAATNRDLMRAVEEGTFRRDLLYRLDVVTLRVPPLRERAGDVARLARYFLREAGSSTELTSDALEALEAYGWPGNVRELAHVMQRLAMAKLRRIEREHLPRAMRSTPRQARVSTPVDERGEVEAALSDCGGNITHAAERLGLTRHGLKKRMARLGMRTARHGGLS